MLTAPNPAPMVWTQTGIRENKSSGMAAWSFSTVHTDPQAWNRQILRIGELRGLKDNWDGEGARAPSQDILDSLQEILRLHGASGNYPAPSRMTPTVDGTIVIEWHSPPIFRSLEIVRPYEGEWLVERPGYRPEFYVERWSAGPTTSVPENFRLKECETTLKIPALGHGSGDFTTANTSAGSRNIVLV